MTEYFPRRTSSFILIIAMLGAVADIGAVDNKAANIAVENFESDAVPKGYTATKGSKLVVTPERFKSGDKSLRWSWKEPESSLTITAPSGLTPMSDKECLAFWLYNEKPSENILWLELLRNGNVVGNCWYAMDFKGWRPLAAPYAQVYTCTEHFMTNPDYPALDAVRLKAPSSRLYEVPGAEPGRLYLDYVNFKCPDKPHADNQQPWIDKPEMLNTATPEKFIYSTHDLSRNRPWLPPLKPESAITAEERESMATIVRRCVEGDKERGLAPLVPIVTGVSDAKVLDDCHDLLKIKRSPDGIITGRPVIPSVGWATWTFNNPPDGIVLSSSPNCGRLTTAIMGRLVGAYWFEVRKGSGEKAQEYLTAFIDLCEHLLDQGFAEGNNNISSSGFNVWDIVFMREELEKAGLLKEMLLAGAATSIALRGDVLMHEDWAKVGYFPRNTDVALEYGRLLALTALLPDPAERLQRLYAYQRAVSLLCDPKLGEPYAWDGTMHHHPQFNVNYAAGVYMIDACNLAGTCFKPYPEAMALLKRSFMMMAFLGGASGIVPPNIPGYGGQPHQLLVKERLLPWAYCDTAESRNGVDPDVAALFLAFVGDKSDDPQAKKFRDMGIKPFNFEGHMTLNGGSKALHRRGDWLVSIAGQHKFRRPSESAPSYIASPFNAYIRHGSVFVVSTGNPPNPWLSGFALEGWDSRLIPGATSYIGETEQQLQDRQSETFNSFGGGTDIDGDGIWGLELIRRGPTPFNNIRFHKSAFCFGDRVTLITADVGRGVGASPEEKALQFATTLFQNSIGSGGKTKLTAFRFGGDIPWKPEPIPPGQEPCWINGKEIKDFPFATVLSAGQSHWLLDNKRTGYYVHPDCPPLRVARREQSWNYMWDPWLKPKQEFPKGDPRNYEATKGDFSTAWFEHGSKPDVAECVYTLIPDSTPERMAEFAKEMAVETGNSKLETRESRAGAGKEAGKVSKPSDQVSSHKLQAPPYRILQKDSTAHILWDRDSNTIGYVVFDQKWRSPKTNHWPLSTGHLLSVNRPCAAMVKEADGKLRVSAASTDMDAWPAWGALPGKIMLSGDIVLTLDGQWEIEKLDPDAPKGCKADVSQGKTVLTIPYETFLPARMTLRPAKQP